MRTDSSVESEIISIALDTLPTPPVDLKAVAYHIGVAKVVLAECRAGFTAFYNPSPTVYISRSISQEKSRFIFAHELGHVMLRLPRVRRSMRNRRFIVLLQDEELLADRIAQTLLMPDAWIESMRPRWVSLAEVISYAKQAGVSPQTLIRRMAASQIDSGMLQWRKASQGWAVIDRPGVSSYLHGCLSPTFVGSWALENAGAEETDLTVDCYLDDRHVAVVGTGIRGGSDVFQLVRRSRELSATMNRSVDRFKDQLKAALALNYDRGYRG